ncbi:xanthine dehydrogenase-like [Aricia agestis]|uniref:xanthine dehydrogenase-like n=1 Tax=Aricia agestis TaxID=91739 RepID=UPI001C208985|nr:xanthine dehydrogenase-like [Aricia agestis]
MNDIESLIPEDKETRLVFFVNGKKVIEPSPDPLWTLLWYLRKRLLLTGTKYGCGEGGCGACTVMLSQYRKHEDRVKHIAVNACLTPLSAVHGLAVTTVEGIGSTAEKLHPVQERIAKSHGSQCGFCTPGIVMSMYTLLRNKTSIKYEDIETALQGNLCRCTGYRPIIEGFKTFIEPWEAKYSPVDQVASCGMGKDCCRNKNNDINSDEKLFNTTEFKPYDPTQEPIFPPELKLSDEYNSNYLFYRGEENVWLRPRSLEELLKIKEKFPFSKIVVGNTEIGVEVKFKRKVYPILISPLMVPELNVLQVVDKGIQIGGAITLTELNSFLQHFIEKNNEKAGILDSVSDMLHYFAGQQVRNVASLVGNIITSSPISDINPILLASSATICVSSSRNGLRKITIDDNFFTGYRKVNIADNEVVLYVEIPFTDKLQFFKAYKQAKRNDDDISIVTAAFNVKFTDAYNVCEAQICYGGMGPTTICASKSSNLIKGQHWNDAMLQKVFESLTQELQLNNSAPGGMAAYRKSLCLSLFFRFYMFVLSKLQYNGYCIDNKDALGAYCIPSAEPESSQCFEIKNNRKSDFDTIGKPIVHMSALKQATGEAIYCDDIQPTQGELYLCLVKSTESYARIISMDSSKALSLPGVVAFLSADDLPGQRNKMGAIEQDEDIFARNVVTSQSCIVGAVVATSENIARKARDAIVVNYEKLHPVVVSIEDAIYNKSYFPGYPKTLNKGNVDDAFSKCTKTTEGIIRNGAQEHFYLETMSAIAVRKEDDLEIVCSSQDPAEVSILVSKALGIPNNKVVTTVKRIGGGFGGKETRANVLAVPVAVAAYKLKKPIRAVFDRDEDMQITGYRHPCLIKYKVAFNDDGKITGIIYEMYFNAGNYMDISPSMVSRAIFHVDNCYFVPNIQVNAYLCKTNTPSNTAFRGFGAPQAMLAAEVVVRDVAAKLNKPYENLIEMNLYREGDLTHFNQKLVHCSLSRCWNECIETSNYWERKKHVEEFNRLNRWKKKGISLVPTKYGISFGADFFMQAGALLHIYRDGSVLLSIGGIEMGQGLFTKMIQVASKALDVDISKVHISEMATDKVPNSSPTAASMSSDLYGMAVLNACEKLNERLKPIKEMNPNWSWEEWISSAYFDRIALSATGFYSAQKVDYNAETNSGTLYEYFTYGVACSEVIIDCLTGDHQVLRTDIVMDLGDSLNPAIDIGQIEGAFVQGYGFYTMEEMLVSPSGEILSKGPGAYKIPSLSDIPKQFNVSLLKGAPNPRAVYSSKAVGEPPLFLSASVLFAIKEAIKSARVDAGVTPDFTLSAPATCARIRMACVDFITQQVEPTIKNDGKPWNIEL